MDECKIALEAIKTAQDRTNTLLEKLVLLLGGEV